MTFRSIPLLALLIMPPAGGADEREPYQSTYTPPPALDAAYVDFHILTGAGDEVENGYVVVLDGKIEAVGEGRPESVDGLETIEGEGRWLTPGIIDVHSHLGVYPSPSYPGHADGNESTSPVTAEVWAEHSVWPQDPQFPLALAGGVTTLQLLPGSANLIGGRSVVVKNVWSRTVQGMKFPGAPHGLKMACGENPKRVYGRKGRAPSTRMGNVAGYRAAWIKAQEYRRKWKDYEEKLAKYESGEADAAGSEGEGSDGNDGGGNGKDSGPPKPPARDLQMETLVGVLEGEILVHNHCYRADEMAVMLDVAREFGYRISAFHHAVESYKIADILAEHGVCSAMWADWTRFKLESFDGIDENVALVHHAGACAIVHSDSALDVQRLNQEAAKALAAGRRMGLDISIADAMTWITLNPARALGIDDRTGSIEAGKMADLVLWDGNPFSVYTKADRVLIDGGVVFDRTERLRPVTDFELGQRVRTL